MKKANVRNVRRKNSPAVTRGAVQKETPFWRRRRQRNLYRRGFRAEPKRYFTRAAAITLSFLSLATVSLGLLFLYHHFLTSPYFSIKDNSNINIQGLRRLTPELILQEAKLGPTTNLLALKPTRVEQALEAHPWIARAEVTRKWPHRLQLRITEREPRALVQMGEIYYVDRQGRLFKPLSPGDPHDFPVITGLKAENFAQGDGAVPEAVAQVFQLLDLLKSAAPPLNLENIAEVHVDLERGLSLYANGLGAALDLGQGDFPEKLKKFAQVLPVLQQKGYLAKTGRINLDYPQRVLLNLKGMEENP
jgi:cell division protein FtsQ